MGGVMVVLKHDYFKTAEDMYCFNLLKRSRISILKEPSLFEIAKYYKCIIDDDNDVMRLLDYHKFYSHESGSAIFNRTYSKYCHKGSLLQDIREE